MSSAAFREAIDYDLNGNIIALNRNDHKAAPIDWLVYDHGEGDQKSNQLLSVSDLGIVTRSFKDQSTSGNDFLYDSNENLVKDLNKGFSSIAYDPYLNFTKSIEQENGEKIRYVHNADGVKLAQELYASGSTTPKKRIDFIGGITYEGGTIKSILHDHGLIVMPPAAESDQAPEYQYQIKDHLGNTRLTFSAEDKVSFDHLLIDEPRVKMHKFHNSSLVVEVIEPLQAQRDDIFQYVFIIYNKQDYEAGFKIK